MTSLQRCGQCRLLYRVPAMTVAENERLYQTNYAEGFTTGLPDATHLQELVATGFRDSPKDYTEYLNVLKAIGVKKNGRLYDFGCSWGYGSYQLTAAGFDVESFEISRP